MISNHEQCFPKMTKAWLYPELHSNHKDRKQGVGMGINRDSAGVQAPLLRGQNSLWTSRRMRKLPVEILALRPVTVHPVAVRSCKDMAIRHAKALVAGGWEEEE